MPVRTRSFRRVSSLACEDNPSVADSSLQVNGSVGATADSRDTQQLIQRRPTRTTSASMSILAPPVGRSHGLIWRSISARFRPGVPSEVVSQNWRIGANGGPRTPGSYLGRGPPIPSTGSRVARRGQGASAVARSTCPTIVLTALKPHRTRQLEKRLPQGRLRGPRARSHIADRHGDRRAVRGRAFHALLTAADLPSIGFHDLRHTAATLLLAQGVDPRASWRRSITCRSA